jgi:hypothetical protein
MRRLSIRGALLAAGLRERPTPPGQFEGFYLITPQRDDPYRVCHIVYDTLSTAKTYLKFNMPRLHKLGQCARALSEQRHFKVLDYTDVSVRVRLPDEPRVGDPDLPVAVVRRELLERVRQVGARAVANEARLSRSTIQRACAGSSLSKETLEALEIWFWVYAGATQVRPEHAADTMKG